MKEHLRNGYCEFCQCYKKVINYYHQICPECMQKLQDAVGFHIGDTVYTLSQVIQNGTRVYTVLECKIAKCESWYPTNLDYEVKFKLIRNDGKAPLTRYSYELYKTFEECINTNKERIDESINRSILNLATEKAVDYLNNNKKLKAGKLNEIIYGSIKAMVDAYAVNEENIQAFQEEQKKQLQEKQEKMEKQFQRKQDKIEKQFQEKQDKILKEFTQNKINKIQLDSNKLLVTQQLNCLFSSHFIMNSNIIGLTVKRENCNKPFYIEWITNENMENIESKEE